MTNAVEVSIEQIVEFQDLAEKLVLKSDDVDDTNFAYFGQDSEGVNHIGFDCWHYGDRDSDNYISGALVKGELIDGKWENLELVELDVDRHFYEGVYRTLDGFTDQVLK